jgi:hypothetical protein
MKTKNKKSGTRLYMHTVDAGQIFQFKKTKDPDGNKHSFLTIKPSFDVPQFNKVKIEFDSDTLKRFANWLINESENITDCRVGSFGLGLKIWDNNSARHIDEYTNKDNYDKLNSIINDTNIKRKQYRKERLEHELERKNQCSRCKW